MKNGIAITGGGDLKAKYVIHIETPSKTEGWAECVEKALNLAESKKLKSISFTAFGTGINFTIFYLDYVSAMDPESYQYHDCHFLMKLLEI